MTHAFPYLLLPVVLGGAQPRAPARAGRRPARARSSAASASSSAAAIFAIVFWLTWQLLDYEELGDYLRPPRPRRWLFLTFLSFLAFSARRDRALARSSSPRTCGCCSPAPVAAASGSSTRASRGRVGPVRRGWSWSSCCRCCSASGSRAARPRATTSRPSLTVVPFVVIPVALGAVVTLVLVNVFPARRARDVLMLMGLLFAVAHRAAAALHPAGAPARASQSLPDVTAFFATLQSPVTPLLPSFWAGETLFAGLRGRRRLPPPRRALDDGARAHRRWRAPAYGRHYFAGWSKAQEARKARFTRLALPRAARARVLPAVARAPRAAGQGPEGLPARHHPVVAAPAARSPSPSSTSTTSACSTSTASRT